MVFVCSVAKGKTRLQFGMKNDGVFGVTQGFKAIHKRRDSTFVTFQQGDGELDKGHADGDARSGCDVLGQSHLIEHGLNLFAVQG